MLIVFSPSFVILALFCLLIKRIKNFPTQIGMQEKRTSYTNYGVPKNCYAIGAASLLYVTLFIINYLYHVFIFVAE